MTNLKTMQVTRKSMLSGESNTMDLPVTEKMLERWRSGGLVQKVMPHLSAEQREFLISGCMPEEWDEMMRDRDDQNQYEDWDDGHYDDDPNPYHGTYSEE
jgi:hypothetical protein